MNTNKNNNNDKNKEREQRNDNSNNLNLAGLYKMTVKERQEKIASATGLTADELHILSNGGALSLDIADKMVENVFGVIHMPLGLAPNFLINKKTYLVPMAVEEASIIAAASKAAKQTLPEGFVADADEPIMIGQLQLVGVKNASETLEKIEKNKKAIMKIGKEAMAKHERHGCTLKDFKPKAIQTARGEMVIIDFDFLVGNAQGANMINTALEYITPNICEITGLRSRLRIVSNLAIKRKVRSKAVWKKEIIGQEVIDGVLDAYEFAKNDVFRCATHNKGIMNGIDAVVLATGNDWRSVEAGAHVFAGMEKYKPLTEFKLTKNGDLEGSVELPLALGIVGPAVNVSPTAKIALKILNVQSSADLAMVMASVGLANNFAAMAALSTVGIQEGHMKLHARNIAVNAGATTEEVAIVADELAKTKDFTVESAREIISKMRKSKN